MQHFACKVLICKVNVNDVMIQHGIMGVIKKYLKVVPKGTLWGYYSNMDSNIGIFEKMRKAFV